MKKILSNLLLIFITISILYFQKNVTLEIRNAITLFQRNVFPSLFPFMVLSPFFIHYDIFDIIKNYLGPITNKLFHISLNSAYLFFMSIISGFPSSASNAKNLYEENYITKEEAFHTLLFSHFSNPIFIFSMINEKPMLILCAHYLSNIIIGFLLRFHSPKKISKSIKKNNDKPFFDIFTTAIKNAMQNSLFVLGVIVFFFMINSIIPFSFTKVFLEVSLGLNYANTLALPLKEIAIIQAFILSFGGFSVHIQTYGILSDWHLPYLPYLLTRIFHGVLAGIIVFCFF